MTRGNLVDIQPEKIYGYRMSAHEFKRSLGLFDSTMVVAGSMVGVGIFIVTAGMSRQLGSPGWLLIAWIITGFLTICSALSYGELAAMMPAAGGQYVYLREAFSPLWGFLYGWTLFLVIQTGTIAAVAVGFGRYLGVLVPWVSEDHYLVEPIHVSANYAVSVSTGQLVALGVIGILTWTNCRGLDYGKMIQNIFTTTKLGAVLLLIAVCLIGWSASAVHVNWVGMWNRAGAVAIAPGLTAMTGFGLFIALCVSQTGSLFAADAWNNITFTAGEVINPRRNIPLSLALGTCAVMALYFLVNIAYLAVLPLSAIQSAPADRVAALALATVLPGRSVALIAVGVLISSFGCDNGLVLSGARAYYAMARDGLFFHKASRLNQAGVPSWGLAAQGVWSAAIVLPRTYDPVSRTYGNLYSDLLTYVISSALIFYILTIAGIFRLRNLRPHAERPYRAFGYPYIPLIYILAASIILVVLFVYQASTTWPGLAIVLSGLPAYWLWTRRKAG
jgi:APA family basic amino acid/polyamine antiporter